MSTVSLITKKNKANAAGEMPIYLRITEHRKSRFIALPIRVHKSKWDDGKKRVKNSYPNSARVNAFLANKVADAMNVALTLKDKSKFVTSKKIKDDINGKKPQNFFQFAQEFIKEIEVHGKIGTYRKIKAVVNKLKEFVKTEDFDFNEFDLIFLKRYDKYLREDLKNTQNTIHANLKVFRRLFNKAIQEEIIESGINPFPKFKMQTAKTKKQYLTDEELLAIENLELDHSSPALHHRNMFIFASYAGGLRISDILQLKWKNFDGTHIRVQMQKTGDLTQVKLPSKAVEILNFYMQINAKRKNSDYIFPCLRNKEYETPTDLHNAISSNTAFANKNLKSIAIKAGIDKNISFHTSRHSFATRALKKGMRIEYVSKILGHQKIQTTQIYAKIVNSDLDNAMDVFN